MSFKFYYSNTASAQAMKPTFSAVLTAMTFAPNSGPQMPYWKGIERLNVETAKETMPPTRVVCRRWNRPARTVSR